MITLKITTHDDNEYLTKVENYDKEALNQQINDENIRTVLVGDIIVASINVKSIVPILDDEEGVA